jgi:hypothetical protein
MREANINTIRTYTRLLTGSSKKARAAGLRVLSGSTGGRTTALTTILAPSAKRSRRSRRRPRAEGLPDVLLAHVIGNEVPPLVARFHGRKPIERFLRGLTKLPRTSNPDALVTYGNFPPTEFLQLDFVDFYTLNLYLLERKTFAAYLDRMLIQAKGKPLLLGEVGEDSFHNGDDRQREVLDWTLPLALEKGACGGLRLQLDGRLGRRGASSGGLGFRPRRTWRAAPSARTRWCGAALRSPLWSGGSAGRASRSSSATTTARPPSTRRFSSLEGLRYPDFEIIYVDDGSTDESLSIADRHRTGSASSPRRNRGLSVARTVGAEAATGTSWAYIDSDAHADPGLAPHLITAMESGSYAGWAAPI